MHTEPMISSIFCHSIISRYVIFATLFCISSISYAARFTISDVGSLGGSPHPCRGANFCSISVDFIRGPLSRGRDVNDYGQVGGDSYTAGDNDLRAFLTTPTGLANLGSLGFESSIVTAINNHGQVVGRVYSPQSSSRPFFGDANGIVEFGGEEFSDVQDINDHGIITGSFVVENQGQHAYIGTPNDLKSLGALGGTLSVGNGINNNGQVAGTLRNDDDSLSAFIGDLSGLTRLGTFGGESSAAAAINDHGVATGSADTADLRTVAFIGNESGITSLGTLGGRSSYGFDINNSGHVVGQAEDASLEHRPFYYDGQTMRDLNDLVLDMTGWRSLEFVESISNTGFITGWGYMEGNSNERAFLLTPVPLPLPIYMFSAALLILGRYRASSRIFIST